MKKVLAIILLLTSAILSQAQYLYVSDTIERVKIEQWTETNTFPDVIKFVQDGKGEWVVGPEVLADPAYEKLGNLSGTKEESLKTYLQSKSTTTSYQPKSESSTLSDQKKQ